MKPTLRYPAITHHGQRRRLIAALGLMLCTAIVSTAAPAAAQRFFSSADYREESWNTAQGLARLFADVARAGGGMVKLEPGDYAISQKVPMELCSNTTVIATGARFLLPEELEDGARMVVFSGKDIVNFSWSGGEFIGHGFDPKQPDSTWKPNVITRIFSVNGTTEGQVRDLVFRKVRARGISGPVIRVTGHRSGEGPQAVVRYAENITVDGCVFVDSGKFFWDYGYLWEPLVWPEEFGPLERKLVERHFPKHLINEIRFEAGGDRVLIEGAKAGPKPAPGGAPEVICFFGPSLPKGIKKGRQYHVVATGDDYIRVSESAGGKPVKFPGGAEVRAKMVRDLVTAYWHLAVPVGSDESKGSVDLVACRNFTLSGCELSGRGEVMHLRDCVGGSVLDNTIPYARMGAMFISENTRDVVVRGNVCDGGNGSRILTVEAGAANIRIVGNTFKNGGRGAYIRSAQDIILEKNIFINNTAKGTEKPGEGRRIYLTGDYMKFSEIEINGSPSAPYRNVWLKDNTIEAGPQAEYAVLLQANGSGVVIEGNIFRGATQAVMCRLPARELRAANNQGMRKVQP